MGVPYDWMRILCELVERHSADEIDRVCTWLVTKQHSDPIAAKWKPLITDPWSLHEHWAAMRREYLESRGRPVVAAVPEPPPTNGDDADFAEFWSVYPKRKGKGQARRAWAKAVNTIDPATIIDGARAYVRSGLPSEPRFIPYPATWLNGERWTDEHETSAEDDTSWMNRSAGRHVL